MSAACHGQRSVFRSMLGLGPTSRYCRGIGWESLLRAQERYMKNEQSSGRDKPIPSVAAPERTSFRIRDPYHFESVRLTDLVTSKGSKNEIVVFSQPAHCRVRPASDSACGHPTEDRPITSQASILLPWALLPLPLPRTVLFLLLPRSLLSPPSVAIWSLALLLRISDLTVLLVTDHKGG
jgi:hypothetical protein